MRAPAAAKPNSSLDCARDWLHSVYGSMLTKVISMNANQLIDESAVTVEQNIDQAILDSIFEIGDEAMRLALCDQLVSDFRRMASGLDEAEPVVVAKISHELKGLAATIGAQRLADLAQTLNKAAESVSPSALAVLTFPVRQEIAGVLAVLETCARAFRQQ